MTLLSLLIPQLFSLDYAELCWIAFKPSFPYLPNVTHDSWTQALYSFKNHYSNSYPVIVTVLILILSMSPSYPSLDVYSNLMPNYSFYSHSCPCIALVNLFLFSSLLLLFCPFPIFFLSHSYYYSHSNIHFHPSICSSILQPCLPPI